ncbi:MAG: ABC transporter substrate-binding protein [Promicromonosporaceae bacterium]|nr:ABC transporter substrate-binding protein [Promicromonosporaceae bacterium]
MPAIWHWHDYRGRVRFRKTIPTLAAAALLLGACAPAPPEAGDDGEANCGFALPAMTSPQRVVTIKSAPAEAMLALGLGELLVGVAFLDGPLPPWLEGAAQDTVAAAPFSSGVPGLEATLELRPDLILAGWESNLTASGVGTREQLAGLGVATWVPPSACENPEHRTSPLTFEAVLADLSRLGAMFGAEEAAAALTAEMTARWEAAPRDGRGLTALWWSSGTAIPFVGGGDGAPQMIMEHLGLSNVAASLPERWTSFSWEAVLAADPDVLVLVDADWNTAAAKWEHLVTDPALSQLTAVRHQRVLVVPFAATEPGVRNAEAAEALAAQLTGLDFDAQ